MRRSDYVDAFLYWFKKVDEGWDEKAGVYVPWDAECSATLNASMLPCLAVAGLEGDKARAARIPLIVERLVASPPWDPEYHYWNMKLDTLGMEPHAGTCAIGGQLAMVCMYQKELGLAPDLLDAAMDKVELMTAKRADMARHAGEVERNCYVDADGKPVDAWGIKCDAIRRGVPADLRWLREVGPSNQPIDMWAAAMAYLATGRESFWDHARAIWGRLVEKEENGKSVLFRCSMDPDYSFIYSTESQTTHGAGTHRYTQSAYALHLLYEQSNTVRVARRMGRTETAWERVLRDYAEAVFGRVLMRDGTLNMVFNSYGWERSTSGALLRTYYLHPLIPIADLTPFAPGELVRMVDESLKTSRQWCETGFANFPPALGLKGFHRSGGLYIATVCASTLAEMILTNPEAMETEDEALRPFRCYSGFAWEQKHFVMQTPVYSLTVVGAGAPWLEKKGYLGLGMVLGGGEYVLKLQGGHYLTPLSDAGRPLVRAQVAGNDLRSGEVNSFNRDDYGFSMEVILADGTRISRGEDFGPSPYDPSAEGVALEVGFGRYGVRLGRRFDLSPESVTITDSIEALDDVEIEHFSSRLPVVTVDPAGEGVSIDGLAVGRPVEIRPPCHMGFEGDMQHYDQDFLQSIANLEQLSVSYPSGYGFKFERLDCAPVQIEMTRGELQENRHMRVDFKNIDYCWIGEPTKLRRGERRSFSYRITPQAAGSRSPV